MAYTIGWNESSPDGATTDAATIDTEFQNLKIALRERLEQVIPDWGTDGTDPKKIKVDVGVDSSKGTPAFAGQVYIATDTLLTYVSKSDGGGGFQWDIYGPVRFGTISNRPANPTYDNEMYVSSDENEVYFSDGSNWWGVVGQAQEVSTIQARAGVSLDIGKTNTSYESIEWDRSDVDTDNMIDIAGANPELITIPSDYPTGTLTRFTISLVLEASTNADETDIVHVRILKDPTGTPSTLWEGYTSPGPFGVGVNLSTSIVHTPNPNDEYVVQTKIDDPGDGPAYAIIGHTSTRSFFEVCSI